MGAEDFRGWIGRSVDASDRLTENKVEAFRATLGPHLAPVANGSAPLAMHWCLATPTAPMAELGVDGHPKKGGFLPPIPLPRRMWAGGEVETLGTLPVDAPLTRRSTISDVTLKEGRSGILWFVKVAHEYLASNDVVVRESQDIVYRDRSPAGATPAGMEPSGAASTDAPAPEGAWRVSATPALLFRYSALTFNTHRIHYDEPYATQEEGYAGLVVHGPLQASLLFNFAAVALGRTPNRFAYRGVSPLIANQNFTVAAKQVDSEKAEFEVTDRLGRTTMKASAS